MSDTDQTEAPDSNDAPQEDAGENGAPAGGDAEGGGNKQDASEGELTEWAKKELSRARAEAANYRTQLREAQAALKEAKTPEEYAAATQQLEQKVAQLERSVEVANVARKFELPDELAELLKGDTPEELEAHAKKLQKFVSTPEPKKLKGGLTPGQKIDGETDPRKLAQSLGRRR